MRRILPLLLVLAGTTTAAAQPPGMENGFGGWKDSAPGRVHAIRPADLPPPYATPSVSNPPDMGEPPDNALPLTLPGWTVSRFASGLDEPRTLRVAPNGDLFLAETGGGRILVFPYPGATATVFAADLNEPFGIAFWPPGPSPRYVYVAETDRVVRFPYQSGDKKPAGPAETIISSLPTGGHALRDIVAAPDGRHLFLSVGSATNDTAPPPRSPAFIHAYEAAHGTGASWGEGRNRADVLVLDADGRHLRTYATGLRNCAGEAIEPATGALWCVVNERDGLGDNLPPDFATHITPGGFYGWPWYYIGDHQDPRHAGERPDLAGKVIVPDLLIQPHSAPLGIAFTGSEAFIALHGSWNRAPRTGYKVVRVPLRNGLPTGGPGGRYEDFLTGFASGSSAWGRPVGVAVARDGAVLVSDDAGGVIWRVARE